MNVLLPSLVASLSLAVALRGLMLVRDRGPADRLVLTDAPGGGGSRRTPITRLLERLALPLGLRVWRSLSAARRARVIHALDRAGRPGGLSVETYLGRQAAIALLSAAGALFFLMLAAPLPAVLLLILGLLFPWIAVSRAGRFRQERIERTLPDFLDVLSVTVRAGLTYRVALARVADSLGGPLGDEVTTTLRQMDLGATRREAFLALAERNDAESLRAYVTAQLQAEELGVPLADALLDITRDMRRSAAQAARRRAQRAAPRVSLIVTIVIVPASIILMLVALFLGSDIQDSGLLG